jgi:hypothetical protein
MLTVAMVRKGIKYEAMVTHSTPYAGMVRAQTITSNELWSWRTVPRS